ncbi:MAG: hypothetical protein H5T96_09400 [Tissierellales bacterium]|nr:hypothetical protein [Tissierellales bacterium]
MKKEVQGYRLKDEFYNETIGKAVLAIEGHRCIGTAVYTEHQILKNSDSIDRLREAGVFDLWFEPVYRISIYKIGDWITVVNPDYWVKEQTIRTFKIVGTFNGKDSGWWSVNYNGNKSSGYYGVSETDIRKATKEEIEKANIPQITIKGYNAVFIKGKVKFGCQEYTNDFIITLSDCLEKNDLSMEYRNEVKQISSYLKSTK